MIELAVVCVAAFLALTVFFSAYNEGITRAVADSLSVRAKDVYVAVAAANAERERVGAPSLWSSALVPDPQRDARAVPLATEITNSTDYFRVLIESRLCEGLTFSSLAGGGVPTGQSGSFNAANNGWTVAVNLRGDLPESLPLMITRNVDLSLLTVKRTGRELGQPLRFDPAWPEPFGNRGYVGVTQCGGIIFGRGKHATYRAVFGRDPFDACVNAGGRHQARPLTYLTPTRALVPGGIRP